MALGCGLVYVGPGLVYFCSGLVYLDPGFVYFGHRPVYVSLGLVYIGPGLVYFSFGLVYFGPWAVALWGQLGGPCWVSLGPKEGAILSLLGPM